MYATQGLWQHGGWIHAPATLPAGTRQSLVLCFGAVDDIRPALHEELRSRYPGAILAGCTTAGEIYDTQVYDNAVSVLVMGMTRTRLRGVTVEVANATETPRAAEQLARELAGEDLQHVLVLSDGLHVNGTELTRALAATLPEHTTASGGLAGDGDRFESTCAWLEQPDTGSRIVGIGFYGTALRVGFGSLGGWDPFGPVRVVTRAEHNMLYELDGQSALALYKRYLGDYAKDLPGSALLFPLTLINEQEKDVVRTVLSVDEASQSMTFAGDIPEGARVRFMKANFDRLVDGAQGAAEQCIQTQPDLPPAAALLISCVGRKMVLRQRIEEETEAVRDILPAPTCLAGFYSYGEISPLRHESGCNFHNQTMTITTFSEADAS